MFPSAALATVPLQKNRAQTHQPTQRGKTYGDTRKHSDGTVLCQGWNVLCIIWRNATENFETGPFWQGDELKRKQIPDSESDLASLQNQVKFVN